MSTINLIPTINLILVSAMAIVGIHLLYDWICGSKYDLPPYTHHAIYMFIALIIKAIN